MKYLFCVFIILFFVACEEVETEEEKKARLARIEAENIKKNNNIISGDGSFSSPYKIYNGVYGALKSGDFFYTFDLSGSNCSIIFYNYNGYIQPNNYNLYKINNSNDKDLMDYNSTTSTYKIYNDLNTSKYILKVNDIDLPNDKFGVYSSCIANDDILKVLEDSEYNYTSLQNLYKIDLNKKTNLKITVFQNENKSYIFDENFTIINKDGTNVYRTDIDLNKGTYYLLNYSNYSTEETIFDIDLTDL